MTHIEQIKKDLLNYPNVQAVGRGKPEGERHDDEITLVAYVTEKVTEEELEKEDVIPKELEGMSVDVQSIGEVKSTLMHNVEPQESTAQTSVNTTSRHRPAPHGVSVGHRAITAGTAGLILWAKEEVAGYDIPVPKTVSNNHVYANVNRADKGDLILQPGPHDGGTGDDVVAELEDYVTLEDEYNLVDVAWADIDGRKMNSYIPTVGVPTKKADVETGDILKKFGRTTGEHSAEVMSTDARVRVRFGDKVREFEDQIITKSMSSGGDSGSAVVNDDGEVAGMLFAGSDRVTVVNKIDNILSRSGLHLNPQDVYN